LLLGRDMMKRFLLEKKWWEMADSNCRPHACHACALTN
jgi:hypothetical protein